VHRRTPIAAAPRLTPVRSASVTPLSTRRHREQPQGPRKKHAWTFVVVPPRGGRVRTWHVRRWQVRAVVATFVAAGLALLLSGLTIGARFASSPFAALDTEMASAELRAASLADTLRALRMASAALPNAPMGPAPTPLVLPVEGRISSRFTRARRHPILGIWRPHLGLDIAAPKGTRVIAPAAGRVRYVGRQFGSGLVVEIDHGSGIVTRYLHLRSAIAQEGQQVAAGTTIATVGSSGLSTAPHLHYEVRVDGRAVDPTKYRLVMPEPPKPTPPVVLEKTE
jgi:murein DD-endopeptidase MepM/ murein hydrolase activator NlpD